MSDKVRWSDFDKLHVIRRLRELVGKWWKIQINFTDTKGLLRGVPDGKFFNPLNPICQAVTGDSKGFEACRGTARTCHAWPRRCARGGSCCASRRGAISGNRS